MGAGAFLPRCRYLSSAGHRRAESPSPSAHRDLGAEYFPRLDRARMGRVARLGRVGHSRSSVMSGTGRLGTTMKITSGLLSLLVLAMAGASPMPAQICGPDVKHSTKAVENKSPLETSPPADKALI